MTEHKKNIHLFSRKSPIDKFKGNCVGRLGPEAITAKLRFSSAMDERLCREHTLAATPSCQVTHGDMTAILRRSGGHDPRVRSAPGARSAPSGQTLVTGQNIYTQMCDKSPHNKKMPSHPEPKWMKGNSRGLKTLLQGETPEVCRISLVAGRAYTIIPRVIACPWANGLKLI